MNKNKLILGINTVISNEISICLFDNEKIFAEKVWQSERKEAEILAPRIMNMIDGKKLDGIAVVVGPGSFTGIRIGVAIANALAYAIKVQIASFTTFDFYHARNLAMGRPTHGFPQDRFVQTGMDRSSREILNNDKIGLIMKSGLDWIWSASLGSSPENMDGIKLKKTIDGFDGQVLLVEGELDWLPNEKRYNGGMAGYGRVWQSLTSDYETIKWQKNVDAEYMREPHITHPSPDRPGCVGQAKSKKK